MIFYSGTRSTHEDECEFAPITCLNRNCTASLRKGELEEHQKVCIYLTCTHEDKGIYSMLLFLLLLPVLLQLLYPYHKIWGWELY